MTDKQKRLLNYLKKVLEDTNTEIQESGSEEFDDAVYTTITSSTYFYNNLDELNAAIDNQQSLDNQNYN